MARHKVAEFITKIDNVERRGRLLDAHCKRIEHEINNGVKKKTVWMNLKSKIGSLFLKKKSPI